MSAPYRLAVPGVIRYRRCVPIHSGLRTLTIAAPPGSWSESLESSPLLGSPTFSTLGSGAKSPETPSPFQECKRFVHLAGTFCPKERETTRHKHLFTAGSCDRHWLCSSGPYGTIHR